jgi:hypothetical protein
VGSGGRVVTIYGRNLGDGAQLRCKFGEVESGCTDRTEDSALCIVPFQHADEVSLKVSKNGWDYKSNYVRFKYTAAIEVKALYPTRASIAGGTELSITGINFVSGRDIQCIFEGTGSSSKAAYVSSSLVTCTTPRQKAVGKVELRVDGLGDGSVGSKLDFEFLTGALVNTVTPSSGSQRGGSVVRVIGSGFPEGETFCSVGHRRGILGRWESSTLVLCTIPAAMAEGAVQIEVSSNGVDYTEDGEIFWYQPVAILDRMEPVQGSEMGGTVISITGRGIMDGATGLRCRFGFTADGAVDMSWVSSSLITCLAPRSSPGNVTVHIIDEGDSIVATAPTLFQYQPRAHISTLFPTLGPASGGTRLTVAVTGFEVSEDVLCHFGPESVAAERVAEGRVLCVSPNSIPGVVSFEVCSQDGSCSASGNKFLFHEEAVVHDVVPSSGLSDGGEQVTVIGEKFHEGSIACIFGTTSHESPSGFVTSSVAVCTTPRHAAGLVSIQVISGSAGKVLSQHGFLYSDEPAVMQLVPSHGPAGGGYAITVKGRSFLASGVSVCKFGWLQTDGLVKDGGTMLCTVPILDGATRSVEVSVSNDGVHFSTSTVTFEVETTSGVVLVTPSSGSVSGGTTITVWTNGLDRLNGDLGCWIGERWVSGTIALDSAIRCVTPEHQKGQVRISVAARDSGPQTADSTGHSFFYAEDPVVWKLHPSQGSAKGGVRVTVEGVNFREGNPQCRFGDAGSVMAEWKSSGQVVCVTPRRDASALVRVHISNDGTEFGPEGKVFRFLEIARITQASPTSGPVGGGTLVHLSAAGVLVGHAVRCQFGAIAVDAVVTLGEVHCKSPAQSQPGNVTLLVFHHDVLCEDELVFAYENIGMIVSVHPRRGPTTGGTRVVFKADGLRRHTGLRCTIGDVLVEPVDVSSGGVVCVTPPHRREMVPVALFDGLVQLSGDGVTFEFYPPAVGLQLSPGGGVSTGGTPVTVHGYGFQAIGSSTCRFGNTSTTATVMDQTLLVCKSPASNVEQVDVQVSMNGEDYSTMHLKFQYHAPPLIVGLSPTVGHWRKEVDVQIMGSGFLPVPEISCRFGKDYVVSAKWISVGLVTCRARNDGPGEYEVMVSNNGVDWTEPGPLFWILPVPQVYGITPSRGKLSESVVVHVSVSENREGSQYLCGFGDAMVEGESIGNFTVRCVAPLAGVAKRVPFSLRAGDEVYATEEKWFEYASDVEYSVARLEPSAGPVSGGTQVRVFTCCEPIQEEISCLFSGVEPVRGTVLTKDNSSEVLCISPEHHKGGTMVYIAREGSRDASSPGVEFTYYNPPRLERCEPAVASFNATRLEVRVFGSNFQNTQELMCRFGSFTVRGRFVTNSFVLCDAAGLRVGNYSLRISTNGVDFGESTTKFVVVPSIHIRSVIPSIGATSGGQLVTLHGGEMWTGGVATCTFGVKSVPATISSSSIATCRSPAIDRASLMNVKLTVGGISSSGAAHFEYVDGVTTILDLHPKSGPTWGNSLVTVSGTLFRTQEAACFFGDTHVAAEFASSSLVTCRTPARDAGQVSVQVVGENGEPSFSGVAFVYEEGVVVESVYPSTVAVSRSGGAVTVTVIGRNFLATPDLACITGDGKHLATWLSPELLHCNIDTREMRGDTSLHVTNNGIDRSASWASLDLKVAPAPLPIQGVETIPILIESVSPLSGTTEGGTTVLVTGSGFDSSSECMFGAVIAAGTTLISSTQLACTSPMASEPGLVSVTITNDGQSPSEGGIHFDYLEPIVVDSMEPLVGWDAGGTAVTMIGSGFTRDEIICRFGNEHVASIEITSSSVVCMSPQHPVGNVSVGLSANKVDFVQVGTQFSYKASAEVLSVVPTAGSENGGATVTVTGSGFAGMGDAQCSFGGSVTETSVLSSTSATCKTPAHSAGVVFLGLIDLGAGMASSGTVAYEFTPKVHITRLSPSLGPMDGGTHVTVEGVGFGSELHCRFGPEESPWGLCNVVSNHQASCNVPSSMQDGQVNVACRADVTEYASTEIAFLYFSPATIAEVRPAIGEWKGSLRATVVGTNFFDSRNLTCRFGQQILPADFLTSTTVTCVTPQIETGRMMVSVSMNGIDFPSDGEFYEAVESAEVDKVVPSMGVLQGGGVVTMFGKNFDSRLHYLCTFGHIETNALFISNEVVSCITPPSSGVNELQLGVRVSGHSYSSGTVTFEFKNDLQLLSMVPSILSEGEGSSVFVIGSTFLQTSEFACRVGDVLIREAEFVTSSVLRCHLPALASGTHSVGVLMDGAEFHGSTIRLRVGESPRLFGLEPSRGLTGSRQSVTVTGSGFEETAGLHCRFGFVEVASKVLSGDELRCDAPEGKDAGAVPFHLTSASMEITADKLEYEYVHAVIARVLKPSSGHVRGGTQVTITGTNMPLDHADFECLFGDAKGAVRVINGSVMHCITPPGDEGRVQVVLKGGMGVLTKSDDLTFLYVSDATVSEIKPCTGLKGGGTTVLVTGSGFDSSSECMFGAVIAAGTTLISSTQLACTSPMASEPGLVSVTITNDGQSPSEGGIHFDYLEPIVVDSMEPLVGWDAGGTAVTMIGSGFTRDEIICRFGNEHVASIEITSSSVVCMSPQHPVGNVSVGLSANKVDFVQVGTQFSYKASAEVLSVVPTAGSENGGATVTVTGSGFAGMGDAQCSFGGSVTETSVLSSTSATCKTPAHSAGSVKFQVVAGSSGLAAVPSMDFAFLEDPIIYSILPSSSSTDGTTVRIEGEHFPADMKCILIQSPQNLSGAIEMNANVSSQRVLRCKVPALSRPGDYALQVTDMFSSIKSSFRAFHVYPIFQISHLFPSAGMKYGATLVSIAGSGFSSQPSALCRFGSETSAASVISSTALACFSPALPQVGLMQVDVSLNSFDFVGSKQGLEFAAGMISTLTAAHPTVVPTEGGVSVTLQGWNFNASHSAECEFGGVRVVASVISSSSVSCLAPQHAAGNVELHVLLNFVMLEDSIPFLYRPGVVIHSLFPSSGPILGGTLVTVTGANFPDTGTQCRFGETASEAAFMTSSLLTCVSPPHSTPQPVAVSLALVSDDSSREVVAALSPGAALTFEYQPPLGACSLSPTSGPLTGGTLVALRCEGLGADVPIACGFGLSWVPAALIETTPGSISCVTPEFSTDNNVTVALRTQARGEVLTGLLFAPDKVRALSLSPSVGLTSGGTKVVILGDFAEVRHPPQCTFGETSVPATLVSSTELRCISPPHAPATVLLQLSQRQSSTSDHALRFTFAPRPRLLTASPAEAPASGGAAVELFAVDVPSGHGAECVFGDAAAPAREIAHGRFACRAPASRASRTRVLLRWHLLDIASGALPFRFREPLILRSVAPLVAAAGGGVVVHATVEGDGAADRASRPSCVFGAAVVAGVWLAPGIVACAAPEHAPATVGFRVGADHSGFLSDQVAFVFAEAGRVEHIAPSHGPIAGGTSVFVRSSTANVLLRWFCHFGERAVAASPRTGSGFLCTAPPSAVPTPGSVQFSFSSDSEAPAAGALRFEYDAAVSLAAVMPSAGGLAGCAVTVAGTGFVRSSDLRCSFGGRAAPATLLSSTLVACTAPALPEGPAAVEVALNGQDFAASGLRFRALPGPEVARITPRALPARAPATLLVHAESLRAGAPYQCVLGRLPPRPAALVSERLARCVLPALPPGNYSLHLELPCGRAAASAARELIVVEPWTLLRAIPETGPLLAAGALVTLAGAGFMELEGLRCRIGGVATSARVLSADRALCEWDGGSFDAGAPGVALELSGALVSNVLPFGAGAARPPPVLLDVWPSASSQAGGTLLTIAGAGFAGGLVPPTCHFSGGESSEAVLLSSSLVSCVTPAGPPGSFAVAVEASGCAAPSASLFVLRQPALSASRVAPSEAPARGGELVTLSGEHFPSDVAVFFGGARAALESRSATALTCRVPPSAQGPCTVGLAVSTPGGALASSGLLFRYIREGQVRALRPSTGSTAGGTQVAVALARPGGPPAAATCYFGGVASPATVESASRVTCLSPRAPAGPVAFSLDADGARLDGGDALAFEFMEPAVLRSVAPSVALATGGGLVTVSGLFFAAGREAAPAQSRVEEAACVFGAVMAPATLLSSSALRCTAPTLVPGEVSVRVTTNGADLAQGEAALLVLSPLVIRASAPRAVQPGGNVTVSIEQLPPGLPLTCVVGARGTGPAARINASAVNCTAPAAASPGNYTLSLVAGGAALSQRVPLELLGPLSLRAVAPSAADARGGEVVSVRAEGLDPAERLFCLFGSAAAPVARVARGEAECVVPPGRVGDTVPLSLLSERRKSEGSIPFLLTPPGVRVGGVWPSAGPLAGGTRVTITGAHFATDAPGCRFGDAPEAAPLPGLVTSTSMVCLAPAGAAPGAQAVRVRGEAGRWSEAEAGRWSEGGPAFVLEALPVLAAASPAAARAGVAGERVTLRGLFPRSHGQLHCRFGGEVEVACELLSAAAAECTLPSTAPGDVMVSASTNGVDFADPALEFSFVETPVPHAARPSRVTAAGGTPVLVSGQGFRETRGAGLECVFTDPEPRDLAPGGGADPLRLFPRGGVAAAAELLSSALLRCRSPPLTAGRAIALSIRRVGSAGEAEEGRAPPAVAADVLAPFHLDAVAPSAGSRGTGRAVTITGRDFPPGDGVFCAVGGAAGARAQWLSSSAVLCWAPPAAAPGPARVRLSFNGQDYSEGGPEFVYGVALELWSLHPSSAPDAGGLTVTLRGDFSAAVGELACLFGGAARVPAASMTAKLATCVVPALPAGNTTFAVAASGHSDPSRQLHLEVRPSMGVAALTPSVGPRGGGTAVTVHGHGFRALAAACRFGARVVPAAVRSDASLVCDVPALLAASPGAHAVQVQVLDRANGAAHGAPLAFEYAPAARIKGVSPSAVASGGGTEVTLLGSGFTELPPSLLCCFGAEFAAARVESDRVVGCASPRAAPPGEVVVSLSAGRCPGTLAVAAAPLLLLERPVALALAPAVVPAGIDAATGGEAAKVAIRGALFFAGGAFRAEFGGARATCTAVNASLALCELPRLAPGEHAVRVSNDGAVFSATGLSLAARPVPKVAAVRPRDLTGADTVLELSAPAAPFAFRCAVGGLEVPAEPAGPGGAALRCPPPSDRALGHAAPALLRLLLVPWGSEVWAGTIQRFSTPAPSVLSAAPSAGYVTGGTPVELVGLDFAPAGAECLFGAARVPAQVVTSSLVRCASPPASAPGRVWLHAASAGAGTSASHAAFEFLPRPAVERVLPTAGRAAGGMRVSLLGARLSAALEVHPPPFPVLTGQV